MILLFSRARYSSSQSLSPDIDNKTISERVISDRDFNSFENNDRQVILAKAEGNPVTPPTNRGPSNFPTPPSGGRPSRPVYVPKYRTAPKTVNLSFGAGANPAGAGGGNGAADQCPVPEKQQPQESKTSNYDFHSKTKQNKDKKRSEQTRT